LLVTHVVSEKGNQTVGRGGCVSCHQWENGPWWRGTTIYPLEWRSGGDRGLISELVVLRTTSILIWWWTVWAVVLCVMYFT